MAATKRALAIRAKKDGITQQINSISDQMRSIRIDRIPQFIPVGIVNDHHSITWMEEIVEDQAPIGAILYALQDGAGRNVSFAKEQK